jgi:hypothetical protein
MEQKRRTTTQAARTSSTPLGDVLIATALVVVGGDRYAQVLRGYPTKETTQKVCDNLDFLRGVEMLVVIEI